MKSFDEYFSENFEDGLSSPSKYILRHTFEAGQQSKQAEVDGLRKRIDEAMKYVSESPLKDVSRRAMINFMDILKGDQS